MKCSVDDCQKDEQTAGLCSGHYHRLKRYGDPCHIPPPRPISKCSIEGCDGDVAGKGYCRKHYKRLRAHGDPLGGGINHGDAQAFAVTASEWVDEVECLPWPYGKNANGYGRINWQGTSTNVHSVVNELAHGERPSTAHETCHKCGNGHLGCVNPHHLYWGTRKENVADARDHGTSYTLRVPTGENNPCAKYSDRLIGQALSLITSGRTALSVARDLGISKSYIYTLSHGRTKRARDWLIANGHMLDAANDNQPVQGRAVA